MQNLDKMLSKTAERADVAAGAAKQHCLASDGCRHLANWTKHTRRLILAYSLY